MKTLKPLDKVVLEMAIEDFEENKLKLGEVNDMLIRYEERHFETGHYRKQLNEVMMKKYINYQRGRENI